jgi:hypothetical protein
MHEAKMSLAKFQRVNQGERLKVSPALECNTTKWTPPPSDTIKMNWDTAMNVKEGRIGLGFIAKNLNGEVMAARSLTKKFRVNPTTAEALVALNAIIFCKELGLDNVIIEGDAMGVIKSIEIAKPTCSCFGHFIEGIHLAMRGLESVKFAPCTEGGQPCCSYVNKVGYHLCHKFYLVREFSTNYL